MLECLLGRSGSDSTGGDLCDQCVDAGHSGQAEHKPHGNEDGEGALGKATFNFPLVQPHSQPLIPTAPCP